MTRRSVDICVISCVAALLLCLTTAPEVWALDLTEVDNQSDEELAEKNWETRKVKAASGTMKCGFLSILVSTVWRGYGHYCIGDNESNKRFLIIEGASLGMIATALLIGSLTDDAKSMTAVWKSLFHFGLTAFTASYFADILGTFKGDSFNLAENHIDPYGHTVDFDLRWIPSGNFNLGLQLGYTFRSPQFWLNPYGYLNVTSLSDYAFGMDVGVSVWSGERPRTYIAVAVDASFSHDKNADYKTIKILPYLEFSLDLGSWFEHLAEVRMVNHLGVGASLYDFVGTSKPFTDTDYFLVLESGLSLNVVRDFNVGLMYRYRNDYVVGMVSAPSRIKQTVPMPGVGVFSLDLSFNLATDWQASLEANFGKSLDFWLGVQRHF